MLNTKQIVSMLVSESKITLYTIEGEVLDMQTDGPYDTTGIVEFLSTKLDGKSAIELNLNNYMTISKAIIPEGYEGNGIVLTQVIDGVKVQGIFYPQKVTVGVEHEGEVVQIPMVEKLQKHANRAADDNSPALRNFLRRIAPVVKDRLHSAEDLMMFIERSDLPLTNDGLIIGYKKVNQTSDGMFVDVHSGKVKQQVGSHVWMDVTAVDPSRNQSCSHGLHVANLGYLSGFTGTHTLIVLVEPANFIAVPHGETNKARVCAYDVIGVMSANTHQMVSSGQFVKNDQTFTSVIADAVAGRTIKPFEAIQVGDKAVIQRVPINGTEIPSLQLETTTSQTKESSGESLETDVQKEKTHKKDILKMVKTTNSTIPSEVIAVFEDLRTEVGSKSAIAALHNTSIRTIGRWQDKYDYDAYVKAQAGNLTIAEQARMLFNQGAFDALAKLKSMKKKSYYALGFTQTEENKIMNALAS